MLRELNLIYPFILKNGEKYIFILIVTIKIKITATRKKENSTRVYDY